MSGDRQTNQKQARREQREDGSGKAKEGAKPSNGGNGTGALTYKKADTNIVHSTNGIK